MAEWWGVHTAGRQQVVPILFPESFWSRIRNVTAVVIGDVAVVIDTVIIDTAAAIIFGCVGGVVYTVDIACIFRTAILRHLCVQ